MTTTTVKGSVLPITSNKIIRGFCNDMPNISWEGLKGQSHGSLTNFFNRADTPYDFSDILNWLFRRYDDNSDNPVDNRLGNGVKIQFLNGFTYVMRNKVTALRGGKPAPDSKSEGSKCLIVLESLRDDESANNRKPIIEFHGNHDYCMEFNRQVRIRGLRFRGNNNNILYVNVRNWDGSRTGGRINRQTEYDADTDSGIGDCRFEQFANRTAIVYRGRNTNVQNCVFTESGGSSTVGVWHFFKDILENKYFDNGNAKPGENRKNLIAFNTFNLNNQAYSIRIGAFPDNNNDTNYSNYGSTQITDNIVNSGRFLKIQGGRVGNNRQLIAGLGLLNNRLLSDKNSSSTTGSSIDVSRCKLSCNITGLFQGGNRASRAISISSDTEIDSLMIDAGFEDYTKKAINLPNGANDNNTIITGYIKGSEGNNGTKGVNGGRLSKNNRMEKAANNREIPDELRKISGTVPRAVYDDQNFNSMVEIWEALLTCAILESNWRNLPGASVPDTSDPFGENDENNGLGWYRFADDNGVNIKDYYEEVPWRGNSGNTTTVKKYDRVFDYINCTDINQLNSFGLPQVGDRNFRDMPADLRNPHTRWTRNANDGQLDNVFGYSKKMFITRPIRLVKEFTFFCPNGRNNMIFWSERVNRNDNTNSQVGLTLTRKTTFNKAGFSSTGADGSDYDNNHPFAGNSGCNLIHFDIGAGQSIVEKCGFAGHRGKVAITWNCDDYGRVVVNDCIFKDCKGGRHTHAYTRNTDQRNSALNYILNNTYHSGGNSTPILIGNYDDKVDDRVKNKKNFSKFIIANNLGDIGSQIVGVDIPGNTMRGLEIIGFTMTGALKSKSGIIEGLVHLKRGRILNDFTMIDCNIATLSPSSVQNGMDYVLIEEGFVLNELNLVSSTMTLTEAEKSKSFTYAIHNNRVNSRSERSRMRICGLFNGDDRSQYVGVNALKQYTTKTSSSSYINLKDTHTYKLFLVGGQLTS